MHAVFLPQILAAIEHMRDLNPHVGNELVSIGVIALPQWAPQNHSTCGWPCAAASASLPEGAGVALDSLATAALAVGACVTVEVETAQPVAVSAMSVSATTATHEPREPTVRPMNGRCMTRA
ncbi:hypothetical protein GQR58_028486 [Nymphon striatum]|nr:hypothetical protein GQR58_028486 [Nymphon striatum]